MAVSSVVVVAMHTLSGKRLKCLILIIRKTLGWGKAFDAITSAWRDLVQNWEQSVKNLFDLYQTIVQPLNLQCFVYLIQLKRHNLMRPV